MLTGLATMIQGIEGFNDFQFPCGIRFASCEGNNSSLDVLNDLLPWPRQSALAPLDHEFCELSLHPEMREKNSTYAQNFPLGTKTKGNLVLSVASLVSGREMPAIQTTLDEFQNLSVRVIDSQRWKMDSIRAVHLSSVFISGRAAAQTETSLPINEAADVTQIVHSTMDYTPMKGVSQDAP